jgi:hypothetical protein
MSDCVVPQTQTPVKEVVILGVKTEGDQAPTKSLGQHVQAPEEHLKKDEQEKIVTHIELLAVRGEELRLIMTMMMQEEGFFMQLFFAFFSILGHFVIMSVSLLI